jgi:hypothetical protein
MNLLSLDHSFKPICFLHIERADFKKAKID